MLSRVGLGLLLLSAFASALVGQTADSGGEFAAMLCRNPKEQVTSELLDRNALFVSVALWNSLENCASFEQHQGSPAKSIEIHKLAIRVAERLKRPDLAATTHYHVGQTYSGMNDIENSIQAYETSRNLFEQTGNEGYLINILADLGASYLAAADYEKAQSYSERSLAIAGQTKGSSVPQLPRPIEYGQARARQTLGDIDLNHGHHDDAIKKTR
jgi:tetratricopeptide (TPR) repeat protein